jgi:triosephosphate isomerase
LVSGNWKMHHDHLQAIRTVGELGMRLSKEDVAILDVSVHPPFTDLRSVQTVIEDRAVPVFLGAQHCHFEDHGAFTGEVSPAMLAKLQVAYVIVGHSERRQLFGETDDDVAVRLLAILRHGMTPILCVGETEAEHDRGETADRLTSQVRHAIGALPAERVAGIVIAYEPIWAIGTGRAATPVDAQEGCGHVRATVAEVVGPDIAQAVRVQYGGSVNPDNTAELVRLPDVDGLLVGGASLDAGSFTAIVAAAASVVGGG